MMVMSYDDGDELKKMMNDIKFVKNYPHAFINLFEF